MVVYADILLLYNILMDYLLLVCCAEIAAVPIRRMRYLFIAAAGGLYALAAALPAAGLLRSVPLVLGSGALLGTAAFPKNRKAILLFLLLGLMSDGLFAACFVRGADRMLQLYFLPPLSLCLVKLPYHHILKIQELLIPVTIHFAGADYHMTALCDSGNTLKDENGNPILIVSVDVLPRILQNMRPEIHTQTEQIQWLRENYKENAIKVISYTTIGNTGKMALIQCEYIIAGKNRINDVYIGLSNAALPSSYQALWYI